MSAAYKPIYTPEEYLAVERLAAERSEYIAGETFNMAGGTYRHSLISGNAFSELRTALRPHGCRTHASDLKIFIPAADAFVYPDVVVVCGQADFFDQRKDVVLNPRVVVEVLSPSTESYDRGTNSELYRSISSLRDLLLISQDEMRVTHHHRTADGWEMREFYGPTAIVTLAASQVSLELAPLYQDVDLRDDEDSR